MGQIVQEQTLKVNIIVVFLVTLTHEINYV